MESSSRRTVLLALGSIAAIFLAGSSCAPTLSLEGRPCPCTADFHCCESINECRPNGAACPSEHGAGGASNSDAGGDVAASTAGSGAATSSGGGGNSPGTGASSSGGTGASGGGAGLVDAGPPRWRPLDAQGAASYEVHDTCDLEIDSNGTPYVAFRGCKGCRSTDAAPPVVLRYDAGKWAALPAQGLLPTTKHAPLVIGTDGTPHLLIDNAVLSFDGTKWVERGPRVPGSISEARNFELDASNRFLVPVYDSASSQLSVVRYETTTWRVLGNVMTSDPQGDRLTRGGDVFWLAHTVDGGSSAPMLEVRRFDGSAWSIVLELDAFESAEFAVTASETTYVARQVNSLGPVIMTEGHGASWVEILNAPMISAPNLRIGPDGSLYAATLLDGYVNLSAWDGSKWTDWERDGLATGSHVPVLRLIARAGRVVPYLCYASGTDLNVMTYE
jgi:hypothetical protein